MITCVLINVLLRVVARQPQEGYWMCVSSIVAHVNLMSRLDNRRGSVSTSLWGSSDVQG